MKKGNDKFNNDFVNRNKFIEKMVANRKKMGFTQLELAQKLNLNVKTIQRYEKEETPINPKYLKKIVKILEIDNTKELVFSLILKTLYDLSGKSYIGFSNMLDIPISRLKQYINATFTVLPTDIKKINKHYNIDINYFFVKDFLNSLDLDILIEILDKEIYNSSNCDICDKEQTIAFINNNFTNDDFEFIRRIKEENEYYLNNVIFETDEKKEENILNISKSEKEILNFLYSLNFEFVFSSQFVEIKNEKLKIKNSIPIEVFKTFITTLHLQIGNIAIKELKKYIDLSSNFCRFETNKKDSEKDSD